MRQMAMAMDGTMKNSQGYGGSDVYSRSEDYGEGRKNEAHNSTGGGKATAFSCAVNLTNTIIGAGMLGLPGAFAGTGYITGLLLIFAGAHFSSQGLRLLALSAETAGIPASFYTVARAALPSFTVFIDAAVALKCFGVATGYLITVGDCMVDAFAYLVRYHQDSIPDVAAGILVSRHLWVTAGLVSVLPFSFFRTLHELRFASALSLVLVSALAVGIVAYAHGVWDPCLGDFEDDGADEGGESSFSCKGDTVAANGFAATAQKFPVFIFAFTCQQNIFPVVNEIQNRTMVRIDRVIASALGVAAIAYIIVAVEGYRTYGANIRGDILLNYPQTVPVTVMRFLIAVMVVLHYPMQLDPSRRCLLSLVACLRGNKCSQTNGAVNEAEYEGHREITDIPAHSEFSRQQANRARTKGVILDGYDGYYQQAPDKATSRTVAGDAVDGESGPFVAITCAFLVLSYGIAMIVDDLGWVLAAVGATGSTMVSYILPGAIYIKLHDGWDRNKVHAWIQLVLGCAIMPTALYFLFFSGSSAHR